LYDSTVDFFYPPDPLIALQKELEALLESLRPKLIVPDVPMSPVINLTEAEIAQAFLDRLFKEGKLVYYFLFIFYHFFNALLFWGVYKFFKDNYKKLFTREVLEVFYKQTNWLSYFYLLMWCLMQFLLFEIDIWADTQPEWYYAFTTVYFLITMDYLGGEVSLLEINPFREEFNGGLRERAFWFFGGNHIEFISVFCVFFVSITFMLDFFDYLPKDE
jgi:hypothetical protein